MRVWWLVDGMVSAGGIFRRVRITTGELCFPEIDRRGMMDGSRLGECSLRYILAWAWVCAYAWYSFLFDIQR